MDKPTVSIIIPIKNDSLRLQKCLSVIANQTYAGVIETIVIDNNSTENIYSVTSQYQCQLITEIKPGSYAARNCGIRASTGEIIAFTDADTIPDSFWIANGVDSLTNPIAGLVAGHIEFTFERDRPNPIEYLDSLLHLNQQVYAERGYAATASAFTFSWMFKAVGMFDDKLLSLGDRQWGERVSNAGYKVVYSPTAIVYHPARSTLKALLKKARFQARSKAIFYPWTIKELINFLLPESRKFYRTIFRDRSLKGIEKLTFLFAHHALRYAIAYEIFILQHLKPKA
jgi:glycosyltransferase involved in cell wall biosynthesis